MDVVTISRKYQIVIPKSIRQKLRLAPGQKIQAIAYGDRVELIPLVSAKELRGFVRGINTAVEREDDRL